MSLFRTPFISPYYGTLETEPSTSVDELKTKEEDKQSLRHFDFVAVLTHAFGITMMIMAFYLFGTNSGGLQWGDSKINVTGNYPHGNMNFHGMFMTSAFVFLQGEALIVYRIFRHEPKILSKSLHVFFHLCTLGLGALGVVSIVKEKRVWNDQNMFSFHSWIGVSILAVYVIQLISGFISFIFPKIQIDYRRLIMPFHRFVGKTLFTVCCAQVLVGNSMYWYFTLGDCYINLSCPKRVGLIMNFYIIFLAFYAISVGLIISKDSWKRKPILDEKKSQ